MYDSPFHSPWFCQVQPGETGMCGQRGRLRSLHLSGNLKWVGIYGSGSKTTLTFYSSFLTLISCMTFLFSISFLPQKVSLHALFMFLAQVFLLPTETNLFYIATQGVCVCATRLLCPWHFPGRSTGVGCHCFLHYTLKTSPNLYYSV